MPSNQTTNYQLSQWVKSDQVKMEDFNTDNAKIDGALKAASDARAAIQAALNTKGDCSISLSTYTGTGKYGPDNPTVITFPRRPTAFIVAGYGLLIGQGGGSRSCVIYSSSSSAVSAAANVTWSGNTLRISDTYTAAGQVNANYYEYVVIGLYAES